MNILANQNGASRFKVFLWFLVLFLIIHVAVKVVPVYMDYARMEDEMKVKASVSQVLKDDDILRDLENKANELDLPLTRDSFIIKRDMERRRMKISTKGGWDVEVSFLWGAYVRTFHFDPVVEEGIMQVP
ncbi:MAG TPA: hypothetical protein VL087_07160 [Nitrospirota bacterium]|nr:hypothetical protein [Nitrospirota bacterium]